MSTLRRLIHGRVDPADHRYLKQEAAARGVSMTACVGDCLREYFALRVEMASVVDAAGTPGERHSGLIHSILARTEERLAATLEARADELDERLRRIECILDRLVVVYLAHTPEVPPQLHAQASASANRRYANFRQVVHELLAKDDRAGVRRTRVEEGLKD